MLTTFDTGSFHNSIQAEHLEELERKQKSGELVSRNVVSKKSSCGKHGLLGATEGMTGSYEEAVELQLTFRSSDGRSAKVLLTFMVIEQLASQMLLGCPTLDKLMFAATTETVELRIYDIELPVVLPESICEDENMAIM